MDINHIDRGTDNPKVSLEGFGLSDYEARTYIVLVKRGSLSISEISYFTGIPRQKCYVTVQRLERKHLARILAGKPVRCQAISPQKSLGGLIEGEETKLEAMRRSIDQLNRLVEIRSEGIAGESRNIIIPARSLELTIRKLLSSAQKGVFCILGGWGANMISRISNEFTDMIFEGKIQLIFDSGCIDQLSKETSLLDVSRICEIEMLQTILIVDDRSILIIGNTEGTGLMIESSVLGSIMLSQIFTRLWVDSIPSRTVLDYVDEKKSSIIQKLNSKKVKNLFIRAVSESSRDRETITRIGKRFLELINENLGVNLIDYPPDKGVEVMTSLLLQEFQDSGNSEGWTSLTSSGKASESPWSFGIAEILRRRNQPPIRA